LFLGDGTARLKSLPIGTGIWPERRLLDRDGEDDFERAPRSVGMVPLRPFPLTKKASRPPEVANPTGISPIGPSDSCLQERNSADCLVRCMKKECFLSNFGCWDPAFANVRSFPA
jgi:hypothetical protein